MQGNAGLRPKVGKTKPKSAIGVVFSAEKTRTRGGRYCKTRDTTELTVDSMPSPEEGQNKTLEIFFHHLFLDP
jgi:hypothetical protein